MSADTVGDLFGGIFGGPGGLGRPGGLFSQTAPTPTPTPKSSGDLKEVSVRSIYVAKVLGRVLTRMVKLGHCTREEALEWIRLSREESRV